MPWASANGAGRIGSPYPLRPRASCLNHEPPATIDGRARTSEHKTPRLTGRRIHTLDRKQHKGQWRDSNDARSGASARSRARQQIGKDIGEIGDPDAIRTRDPQIRNLMLYPAELRDHWKAALSCSGRSGDPLRRQIPGRQARSQSAVRTASPGRWLVKREALTRTSSGLSPVKGGAEVRPNVIRVLRRSGRGSGRMSG